MRWWTTNFTRYFVNYFENVCDVKNVWWFSFSWKSARVVPPSNGYFLVELVHRIKFLDIRLCFVVLKKSHVNYCVCPKDAKLISNFFLSSFFFIFINNEFQMYQKYWKLVGGILQKWWAMPNSFAGALKSSLQQRFKNESNKITTFIWFTQLFVCKNYCCVKSTKYFC